MKTVRVAAAIIHDKGRIFATQERLWSIQGRLGVSGGKIEPGETPEEAVIREIREELDTQIEVEERFDVVEYDYPDFHLTMDCSCGRVISGDLTLKEHEAAGG